MDTEDCSDEQVTFELLLKLNLNEGNRW
jgi:hypothetical protein